MSKEEILNKFLLHRVELFGDTISINDALLAMQEFSNQENFRYLHMEQQVVAMLSVTGCKNIIEVIELFKDGKVAVAFAEWKENSADIDYDINLDCYFIIGSTRQYKTHSDLYQYWIENVYKP